jgi:hypothetical protein
MAGLQILGSNDSPDDIGKTGSSLDAVNAGWRGPMQVDDSHFGEARDRLGLFATERLSPSVVEADDRYVVSSRMMRAQVHMYGDLPFFITLHFSGPFEMPAKS